VLGLKRLWCRRIGKVDASCFMSAMWRRSVPRCMTWQFPNAWRRGTKTLILSVLFFATGWSCWKCCLSESPAWTLPGSPRLSRSGHAAAPWRPHH